MNSTGVAKQGTRLASRSSRPGTPRLVSTTADTLAGPPRGPRRGSKRRARGAPKGVAHYACRAGLRLSFRIAGTGSELGDDATFVTLLQRGWARMAAKRFLFASPAPGDGGCLLRIGVPRGRCSRQRRLVPGPARLGAGPSAALAGHVDGPGRGAAPSHGERRPGRRGVDRQAWAKAHRESAEPLSSCCGTDVPPMRGPDASSRAPGPCRSHRSVRILRKQRPPSVRPPSVPHPEHPFGTGTTVLAVSRRPRQLLCG